MKKGISFMVTLVLLLALLSVGPFTVSAGGFENKVYDVFTYNVVEDTVSIIDVRADTAGAVRIPSSIEGYPVTVIGERAFDRCNLVETIEIPAKVELIEGAAFESCTSLTNITIASGNKAYCTWDGVLFDKKRTELRCYPAGKADGEYAIPDGVKTVAAFAFAEAAKLESVTIADSVEKLDEKAFYACTGLQNIVFGIGLTTIGSESFADCTALESITIPNSVTDLGRAAFSGCSKLSDVTFGRGLKSISGTLFLNCVSLKNVGIPDNIKGILSSAFSGCSGLVSITIPRSMAGIGSYAFRGCNNLKTVLYTGTETEKSELIIGAQNEILDAAEWQYNAPSVQPSPTDTPVGRQLDGYLLWRWASIGGIVLVIAAVIIILLVYLIKGVKQRK